jgi:predicted exporter
VTPPAARRAWPVLAALFAAALLAVVAIRGAVLRSDMSDLLPEGRNEASRLMLDELRSGTAATLILIGIEGADRATLARLSRDVALRLQRSGQFALVSNGAEVQDNADEQTLFAYRYLLSPAVTSQAFTVPALRGDFERVLDRLESSAAPLAAQYGLADPQDIFLGLARSWAGESRMRTEDGVWFAPDGARALLLARTRAGGLDLAGQQRATAAIDDAFRATGPGPARLLVSGPAVFARDAADAIRGDVQLLSVTSSLLVVGLLWWRFRSPLVIAAIAVPVVLGIAAATLVVQAVFGFVHGVAFGFGMTMLGITVDYPVLLVGHRKRGEQAPATLRRIGTALNLAVATAALGLIGMVFSGFPGLAQLGTFALVGLLVAAAATRWLMPRLIVAADLAPVAAGEDAWLLRLERVRTHRAWALLPVAAACAMLVARPPALERRLEALSPVPQRARDLDAALRQDIGAPDVGQVAFLRGTGQEDVLRREEALSPVLDGLQRDGVIAGADIAVRFLPSVATQLARRAALPAREDLEARVAEAQAGLPFRPDAFRPFVDAVAATRVMAPLRLETLTSPLLVARLQALLVRRDGAWLGLIAPRTVADPAKLAAALGAVAGVTYLDIGAETNALVAAYTRQAWWRLAAGGAAAVAALALGLRDVFRLARLLAATAAAGLVTVAVLAASGQAISLVHIVSLQLVAGVGLDYALFLARRQLDLEERARTLRTLATCNAMTLLTFGLLALCRTPLLRDIGLTVATGAVAMLGFAFLLVGPRPSEAT